jgi:hypothetical protein
VASTNFDLASVGYEQAEYFVSGTATAYTSATPLSSDGKWTVRPGTTARYKTRMVVYRPIDPKKFNGTVIIEWNNVSAVLDSAPIWLAAHDELVREGCAWVGVSAQQVGVKAVAERSSPTSTSSTPIRRGTAASCTRATRTPTTCTRRRAGQ